MRDATGIWIDEIIVHILDARGRGYVESQACLPIDKEPLLKEYFIAHIETSLQTSAAIAARFRGIVEGSPAFVCMGLLAGDFSLVEGSQALARRLYAILEGDSRTKPADLAVCFYRAANYPDTRFLAILKIDPSEILRHVVLEDPQGRTYVTYRSEPEAFTREKLQKCAFIRSRNPHNDDYDMILLDTQVRDRRRRDVAKYFQEKYLDAEDALDKYRRTDFLYLGIVDGLNLITPQLDDQAVINLESHIEAAITSTEINLDTWVNQLPISEEARSEMDRSIRNRLPDREFALDQDYGNRLARKRYFRGDHGFKMQVDRAGYARLVRSSTPVHDGQGRLRFYRVVLEVPGWREVTPP